MRISIGELAGVVVVGVAVGAAWILAVLPEQERAHRVSQEFAQLEPQVRSSERSIEALAATQRDVREGKERLRQVEERILGARDLSRILTALSSETHALGIQVVSMRPLQERAGSRDVPTRQLPVELELQGRFLDLGRYLEGLHAAPLLFTIEGVQITRADKGTRLAMRLTAVAHIRPQGS